MVDGSEQDAWRSLLSKCSSGKDCIGITCSNVSKRDSNMSTRRKEIWGGGGGGLGIIRLRLEY